MADMERRDPRSDPPDLAGLFCTDCSQCRSVWRSTGSGAPVQFAGLAAENVLRPRNQWFRGKDRNSASHCPLCHHRPDNHASGLNNSGIAVTDPTRAFGGNPADHMVFRQCRVELIDDEPEVPLGVLCNVSFSHRGVGIAPSNSARTRIGRPTVDVLGAWASGSGEKTEDLGLIGFGTTVGGFVAAVAAASLVNAATTTTTVESHIHVAFRSPAGPGEWIFQTTALGPDRIDRALHGFRRLLAPPAR